MGAFSDLLKQEGLAPAAPTGPATPPGPMGMAPRGPFSQLAASEGVGQPGPFSSLLHQEANHLPAPAQMVPAAPPEPGWPLKPQPPFGGAFGPTVTRMLDPDAPRFSPQEVPGGLQRAAMNIPQSALELARSAAPPEMGRALEHPVDLVKGVAEWVGRSVLATGESAAFHLSKLYPPLHQLLVSSGITPDAFDQMFTSDPVGTVAGVLAPFEARHAGALLPERGVPRGAQPPIPMEQAPPGPTLRPRAEVVPEAAPVLPAPGMEATPLLATQTAPARLPAPAPSLPVDLGRHPESVGMGREVADLAERDQRLQAASQDTRDILERRDAYERRRKQEEVEDERRIQERRATHPAESTPDPVVRAIPPASEPSPGSPEAVPTPSPEPTQAAAGPSFAGAMMGAKGKILDLYDLPEGFAPEISTRKKVSGDTLRAAGYQVEPTPQELASALQETARKRGTLPKPIETVPASPPVRRTEGPVEESAAGGPQREEGHAPPTEPASVTAPKAKLIGIRKESSLPGVNPREPGGMTAVLRHLAQKGQRGLEPVHELRSLVENHVGEWGSRILKKGGMRPDEFAEWLHQNYPEHFQSREDAMESAVNVAGRDYGRELGPLRERRSPGRWKAEEARIRSRAQELGIDPDRAVEAAQALEPGPLDEADIAPGDVIHHRGDLYRAEETEGGIRLKDGGTIDLKPGEEIQGAKVGVRESSPPGERALPGMEEAAASRQAHEEGVQKLAEQDAAIEKKRKQAERTGQGSLLDQEANRRVAEEKKAREQEARDEAAQGNIFSTEEGTDAAKEAIRQKRKKKGPTLYAGFDPIHAARELVDLSRHVAERLARAARDGRARFTDWHREMRGELEALGGIELSRDQFNKLWAYNPVRHAALLRQATAALPPGVNGRLKVFMREAGIRGQIAFDLWRRGQNRINLGKRLISEDSKRMFKGLSQTSKDALAVTLAGIKRKDTGGGFHYGALVRAGIERAYVGKTRMLPKPGTLLPDGRFVGWDQPNGKDAQLYRVIWPHDAYAVHEALKKNHPEAARVMDEILANSEPPVVTVGGDRLPSRSRVVLKRDWKVEGLTDEEALDAQALAAKAYGRNIPGGPMPGTVTSQGIIPNEFSWIPESAVNRGTFTGRVRNVLRGMTASARKYKSGEIAEQVRKGLASIDIEKGLKRTRQELLAEAVSQEVAKSVLALVAEPIKKGETLETLASSGYRPFSKTGLYGESVRFRRFIERHKQFFEDQGIDVPDVMEASHLAGGKGHKIPSELLDMLAPGFGEKSHSINPRHLAFWKAVDSLGGNMVGAINVWRLTRVSTAMRNLVSNQIVYTAKVTRDFYEDAIRLATLDPQALAAPFVTSIADVRALGTAMGKSALRRLPPEMLGATWLDEAEKAGGIAAAGGKILRYTGFNLADIYTKRLIMESVIDASARQAWADSGRQGSKKPFLDNYKNNVPKQIESLAYREMDTWGGYDYANVHPRLEALKRSAVGRAIVPYPTYYAKLLNTYMELAHPQNVTRAIGLGHASKRQRIRAAANLLSFATMATVAWKMSGDDGDLPDELTEQDLPLEVQKFGRVKVASLDKEGKDGLWVRLYDMPFLGETMAAKGIWRGEMNLGDYVNDRIALGPLFNTVAISAGLTNRYNKDMPVGAAMGREVSSWVPFAAELGTVRRLTDPLKRKGYDEEDRSYWRNFARGFSENYPILSSLLEPRVSTVRLKASTYRPSETWLSYGLLNTHFINEDERQIAIKLAEASKLDMRLQNLNEDTIRAAVLSTMDSEGWTLAGRIKRAGKVDSQEAGIERSKKLWQADVLIAYKDGGYEKALAKAKEIRDAHKDELAWRGSAEGVESLLKRLEILDKAGLAYKEFEKAPPDIQKEFKESVKEDISKRGKIRLKRAQ